MKNLYLVRHAKSSWEAGIMNDHDRTLNERGHQEAKMMAKKLFDKKIVIDKFVSSTATRAFTTSKYFAAAYSIEINEIEKIAELYHAESINFINIISSFSDTENNIAIFSHNPGITHFTNSLTSHKIIDMPTCGIFAISIDCRRWKDFEKSNKNFLFFEYP